MDFLKLTYGKIFLAVLIFVGAIFFFLPIKERVICAVGETCPDVNRLIRITELAETTEYSTIHYWFVLAELLISYIFAAAIIHMSGRGGSVNFLVKE